MILRCDDPYARVVVPDHTEVRQGTLRRIIADAGLTVDQFLGLLRR
jgi:predicted RNA binding protein YcfA (HicA-like mRNA interferase family)